MASTPKATVGLSIVVRKPTTLSASDCFQLGYLLDFIRLQGPGSPVLYSDGKVSDDQGGFLLHAVKLLISELERTGLARKELGEWRSIEKMLNDTYSRLRPPLLAEPDEDRISHSLTKLEALVRRELSDREFVEPILPDGILPYSKLRISGVALLFAGRTIPPAVPEIVKQDLEEAVQSLIHGQTTASSMIALRAAEGMMRDVYGRKLRQPTLGVGWKTVEDGLIAHLSQVGMKSESESIASHLKFLRGVRNEVEHPQERHDLERSERALQHSVEVIGELAKVP